jgi:ppGpp synthetase/RelA/SpoT-type nucleotidyltranferase
MNTSQTDYYEAVSGLAEFGILLCGIIAEVLSDAGVPVHSVSHRVKDFESTLRKLNLKTDRYSGVSDLTDLLGIRVITYFSDDVDKVAEVIRSEFKIDSKNSIDKRKALDPNQFGYLSLHFVAGMTNKRSRFTEYKRFGDKKFELQIRSILQHAWAEIEHDLGYKAKSGLPDQLKRRFFRLAGMLELADEEFERLRREISDYENEVGVAIKQSPQTLPINQSTLMSSLENEQPLKELDEIIAKVRGSDLRKEIDPLYVVREGDNLKILGVKNIDELHDYAIKYKKYVKRFAELWLNRSNANPHNPDPTSRGIGLFYLNYVLAVQRNKDELKEWGLHISTRSRGLLDELSKVWAQVVKELGQPQE